MKEIKLKDNNSGKRVYVDEPLNFRTIPLVEFDVAILSLEALVYEMIAKNAKNRRYEQKRKQK